MSWSCRHARLLTRLLAAVIFPLLAAPAYGTPEGPSGGALEPRAPQSDVLIFESGERMSGKLKACVGNRCQLDSSSVPLATIVWIGFEEGERQTPKVEDPARDELHLRDGSVKSGHLLGISLGVVALQEGSYDRTDVAWLHLGGRSEPPKPTAEAGQEAGGDSAPASTPPPPSSGEATPTPPSSAPPPSPPPSRPSLPLIVGSGGVHRGHLWTGTIRVRLRTGSGSSAVIESRSEIKVRMREFRTLLKRLDTGKVVGEQILLDPENTVMKSDYRLDSDGEDGSFSHCKGTGTQTLAWTPSDPHGDQSSFVLVNRSKAGTLPLLGFSVARGTPR
ncbi:MAG TPA: hypothetical protein VKA53_10075, partial [Thermoanaerobaculia bacterium]|nr:hypothetical protein [Thermoanaerobaculia bacterium]